MSEFSTTDMKGFFAPEELKRIARINAALDAVMDPEQDRRYHNYHPKWAEGREVAQIDNGAGDDMFCIFSPAGVVIKGFDHESDVSPYANGDTVWPGIYDNMPENLSALLDDVALSREDVTFCIWRLVGDSAWRIGPVAFPNDEDDGSSFLLGTLYPKAEEYEDWASYYYDQDMPLEVVEQVYTHMTLNAAMAKQLNPECDFARIADEIRTLLNTVD